MTNAVFVPDNYGVIIGVNMVGDIPNKGFGIILLAMI